MTPVTPLDVVEINGRPATGAALRVPAFNAYGHFTAMQIRGGRVRGRDLHLARLDSATRELFGAGLDGERVRDLLRHALGEVSDASARVYAHWPEGDAEARVMVTVRPPQTKDDRPHSVLSVPYAREVPHIKHPDFGQLYHLRAAERAGFDEALLTAPGGLVTEGAVTNIAFWDGTSVVWPQAPSLLGITMALLEPRLPSVRRPVTLADLPSYASAFLTNSQGIAPVHRIDDVEFTVDAALMETVRAAYEAVEWDEI
ncbi:aminotransferase class IV [Streptomyces sp. NBC_01498]|uniref:aminotransferase class IV n=1 Tax=Streptomyces sp. NBC_01498 TaxID=2975870 RepID=UPI002E7BF7A1|nr:aminotransferase class IV [Streptomyces sp. NBC_01498]WTL27005.1 aminotransferase class IV [Streptomyces sp. NBC_01498]